MSNESDFKHAGLLDTHWQTLIELLETSIYDLNKNYTNNLINEFWDDAKDDKERMSELELILDMLNEQVGEDTSDEEEKE